MGASVLEPLYASDPAEVGGFRLAGRLGKGAMGVVYLGYHSTRPAAVKVVKPTLADDEYFRRRFAQELEAIRRVGGFHTAALLDADAEAQLPWIATEYIHAPSLLELVQEHGPVDEIGGWWLAAGLADALTHIHSVGLLHRDLKPSNVLVTADSVRVIDFGISHVSGTTGLTTANAALGTLAYMAPEQAADSRKASIAADVYSLAATLVHAATGHVPFHAQLVAQRTLDVDADLTGLPPGLYDLIAHALAFDADDRPTPQDIHQEAMDHLLDVGVPLLGQSYPPLPDAFLIDVIDHEAASIEPEFGTTTGTATSSNSELVIEDPPWFLDEPGPDGGDAPPASGRPWAARWRNRIEGQRGDYGG